MNAKRIHSWFLRQVIMNLSIKRGSFSPFDCFFCQTLEPTEPGLVVSRTEPTEPGLSSGTTQTPITTTSTAATTTRPTSESASGSGITIDRPQVCSSFFHFHPEWRALHEVIASNFLWVVRQFYFSRTRFYSESLQSDYLNPHLLNFWGEEWKSEQRDLKDYHTSKACFTLTYHRIGSLLSLNSPL